MVSREQSTGIVAAQIDLAVWSGPDCYLFYEIETYNSLRVAMGQLMEYCYFMDRCVAERLVIVSDHKPEPDAMRYLENIRERTGLPMYYAYFDVKSGELVE